jgi:hypothetical protein
MLFSSTDYHLVMACLNHASQSLCRVKTETMVDHHLGFVFGAIGVGFIADLSSSSIAIQLVAWIAVGSGIFVLLIMKETRKDVIWVRISCEYCMF